MQAALPGIAEIRGGADAAHLQRVASALSQAMLLVSGLVFCVVLVVNEPFIARWMPTNPYGGDFLTLLLLSLMLVRHWNFAVLYTLFALGGERRIALTTLADGIVTVIASVILVANIGVIGAPIGSMIGVVLVSLPANLRGVARASGLSPLAWMTPLWGWTWRFVLLGVGAFLASRLAIPATIPALVATTVTVGAIVAGVMAPVALRAPLGPYVRARLSRLLPR
jgi:O-antigen/teichoic acid export membrane protein